MERELVTLGLQTACKFDGTSGKHKCEKHMFYKRFFFVNSMSFDLCCFLDMLKDEQFQFRRSTNPENHYKALTASKNQGSKVSYLSKVDQKLLNNHKL